MRRLLVCLLILICSNTYGQEYLQIAYVKTKGTKDAVGTRIPEVRVKIEGDNNVYRSNSRGEIDFKSHEQKFSIERVEHKDYELLDFDIIGASFDITEEPFPIVIIDKNQLSLEISLIYNELYQQFQDSIKSLNNLKIDYDKVSKQFREIANRLAKVDYDLMSAKDKEIQICMERGEFSKADSLILSKGSIEERIEYNKKGDKIVLKDFYLLSVNALSRGDIDKALYYLEQRVNIAPDDIESLNDAGTAFACYQTNAEKTHEYFEQAHYFAKKKYGPNHTKTLRCKLNLSTAATLKGDFSNVLKISQECLNVYNVPSISSNSETSTITGTPKREVLTSLDSAIVSDAYSCAMYYYSIKGDFNNALEIFNKAKEYYNDNESTGILFSSVILIMIQANMLEEALELIQPYISESINNPITSDIAPMLSISSLCNANLGNTNDAITQADSVINFYKRNNQMNDYVCNAMLAKSIALANIGDFEKMGKILTEFDNEFYKLGTHNLSKTIYATFLNNKAIYLTSVKRYEEAKETLDLAYNLINELTDVNSPRFKGLIFLNYGYLYYEINEYEYALEATKIGYMILKELYEPIGLRNSDIAVALSQMADIEHKLKYYFDAFESYKLLYIIFEHKDFLGYIDKCYNDAYADKKYPKKDLRKFTSEYQKFKAELSK